ncbi:3'5'-cyclic nucleotide phosphodiesterase family protein [Tritrichomonas foetus]|uniref:3'5'-cyclic nucleotide phosphodiesterase family protein n=1 Tax=Tritrichomonas foetus TaxID=1144522 RepID=A0A1J4KLR4_9EUKA|nr:3'5'-cyclic nucleotide phosphodiesterase family protein [Tritrichomonas foetus]|eukprot:OHT12155.1 3'5'-cyclic nucleotide phosphodiesterase family protein [Tritrichomonas foetus]
MAFGHYGIDPRKSLNESMLRQNNRGAYIKIPSVNKTQIINSPNSYQYQAASKYKGGAGQYQQPFNVDVERRYELIENMLHNLNIQPINTVLEQTIIQLMNASTCIVWLNNPSLNILYAPTVSLTCKYQTALVGLCYRTKDIISIERPSEHESFNVAVDNDDSSTILIPLLNDSDDIFGVAQVMRSSDWLPFVESDEATAQFFATKFTQLSHLISRNVRDTNFVFNVINASNQHLFKQMHDLLSRQYRCRSVEFWSLDDVGRGFYKYESDKGFTLLKNKMIGAVGPLLQTGITANIEDVSKCQGYAPDVDGVSGESLLLVPSRINSQCFGIVLRAKAGKQAFSTIEANQLDSLAPLIARALIDNVIETDEDLSNKNFALRLKALLEVAEILSGVLDIDVLIPTIMDRACSLLSTERCSLFLVDNEKQELVSRFHGGLDRSIRVPLNRGIVGHTAQTGNVVNITDAYSDQRFNKAVDLATGFKTRTILTVPIYNNRGEIGGVTEMINRIDGSAFDEEDIKMMKAFNVFCGISLDNAKLYQTSLDLTRQLRGFVSMSSALNKTKTVRDVIEEILDNAKVVIHASRATIFLKNADSDEFAPFVNIGSEIVHGTLFAKEVYKAGKTQIFTREDVMDYIKSDDTTNIEEEKASGLSRVSSALSRDQSIFESQKSVNDLPQFEPICGFPLINNDGKTLGIMELSCSWKILPEDVKLLDCFAVFAAISLEKSELQDIAKFGKVEMELKQYITDEERKLSTIPTKLRIPENEATTIYTVNFDAPEWAGIGFFKVVFAMFDSFNLLETFKIPSETFFRFLSEISQTYNPVPYHNWRHAVDVTQFLSFEIRTSHVDQMLPKFDMLALLTAAVCHDANHDGFTNVFNEKAETPLGILFKNQSVMETHHCSVSIGVISKAENNIFANLSSAEYKHIWTLIIQLILFTDMAKHFDFLKAANAELDKGPLDMSNEEHRIMLMRAILKCGDVSNVSRPFELADKWCDVLCEEFFRQGDLEMASGMEYTSPLNDREHLDKPKSQIGFYTFVCLPLFEVTARMLPELVCNVNQIKSNLEVWKKAAAEKAAAEEAAKAAAEKAATEEASEKASEEADEKAAPEEATEKASEKADEKAAPEEATEKAATEEASEKADEKAAPEEATEKAAEG